MLRNSTRLQIRVGCFRASAGDSLRPLRNADKNSEDLPVERHRSSTASRFSRKLSTASRRTVKAGRHRTPEFCCELSARQAPGTLQPYAARQTLHHDAARPVRCNASFGGVHATTSTVLLVRPVHDRSPAPMGWGATSTPCLWRGVRARGEALALRPTVVARRGTPRSPRLRRA
jgi:hypothetical protein